MNDKQKSKSNLELACVVPSQLEEAGVYESLGKDILRCHVCVRHCILSSGEKAACGARRNIQGRMHTLPGFPISRMVVSPIERLRISVPSLPLGKALVAGAFGCNFSCLHCLNAKWSQVAAPLSAKLIKEGDLMHEALGSNCKALCFSITEPLIHLEHVYFALKKAKSLGLVTILCTNGSFSQPALDLITEVTDCFRIDLKGLSDRVYDSFAGVPAFREVLDNIRTLHDRGKEVALQFVPVPGVNDDHQTLLSGIRRMDGLQRIPVALIRFIPAAWLQGRAPADDVYLHRIASWFSDAGFDTTIMEV